MFLKRLCPLALGLLLASIVLQAQTFEINQGAQSSATKGTTKKGKGRIASEGSGTSMGWGSSIEVARQARAVEQALNQGDYKAAVDYAQHAAQAAPQNPEFWFLLGYAARLAGRYSVSMNAYQHGLSLRPSSVAGLSGLAQTYAKMGRTAEAKDLIQKVLAVNSKSADDLRLAGELSLYTDPHQSLEYFQRAEALGSSARGELLIARAYQRLGDTNQSRRWLEMARSRAPRDPEVVRSVAGYYRETGQYDLALATLKSIPLKDANSLAELAYSYQLAGDKKNAADTYMRAADVGKGRLDIQLNAAQALVNAGDFDRAQALLKRAAGMDANHYRLFTIRGQIDALEERPDEAIRQYQLAISHLPESVPEGPLYPISLHLALYQLYRDTDEGQAAQREITTARNLIQSLDIQDTTRPEFLRQRATVKVALNDMAGAERDLKEALSLAPSSTNIVLNYANLLWKADRRPEALKMYQHALQLEAKDPAALSALGYLSRQMGDAEAAEQYFKKMITVDPDHYVAYLGLGDLYTERRQFRNAQTLYEKAHQLNPSNALIFAGGINSALEAHQYALAKSWLDRANQKILNNPQVMREHERYLTMTGKYQESAELGYQAIQKLPRDPEAPVYLAYDLLFLNRYPEAMEIVRRFEPILPGDKDLPLIAGYVHAHDGEFQQAINDFTRALERDPQMATGYMNRGYVENDMRLATRAEQDFHKAIQLRPDYGEAHLGLAYAYLQLRRARPALKETELAQKYLGDSRSVHLARAESFRQQVLLRKATSEYEAALKFQPNDPPTYLAQSEVQYRLRRYDASIQSLTTALKYSPDPMIYAHMARSYARLHREHDALQAIERAERSGGSNSKILLTTADALLILRDRNQAMDRYARALELSDADRLDTRLALARLFAQEKKRTDAEEQIALGFAEARVSDASVITAENYLDAADILMSLNNFKLADQFYLRAQNAGADELSVAIGMANAHLAMGETRDAQTLLTSVAADEAKDQSYDYLVSLANVYRQKQDTQHALSALARANSLVGEDEATRRAEFELADEEGREIMQNLSIGSQILVHPIFEDENIYQMDARLRLPNTANANGLLQSASFLPSPRKSVETFADERFRLHWGGLPLISGFVGERNARGTISFPSELLIQRRNTYDTIFNGSLSPVVNLGNVKFVLTPGLQYTIRRDTASPVPMNQDLFRQFLYVSSSPIGNWLSFSGDLIREAGPFTEQHLHSRDLSAALNFTFARPWWKTSMITGYTARDLLFRPSIHEYYQTSVYGGLEHRFGSTVTASALAQYLRGWRVENQTFAVAQSLEPGFSLEIRPNQRWRIDLSGGWSKGTGLHAYDNYTNGILISYMKPLRGAINDGKENIEVSYPLRFSLGLEQQTFYDFPGHARTSIVPVVQLTLF